MDVKLDAALLSVYRKERLHEIVPLLQKQLIKIFSTGGTLEHIRQLGYEATSVEDLTGYPSLLGGRVKTLHPKVFGGILARRDNPADQEDRKKYDIPLIDLVMVDLYPFEETVRTSTDPEEIIEKIDIGGVALIRAAAKNHNHVLVISSSEQYDELLEILQTKNGVTDLETRKRFAREAFDLTSRYDAAIRDYLRI